MRLDYTDLYAQLEETPWAAWNAQLPDRIAYALRYERHGLLPQWEEALARLPATQPSDLVVLDEAVVVEGPPLPELEQQLKTFHPWRKGPYHIHGVHIDTEWRSDWKWDRLRPHIQPLDGRTVLDVGCGNGYHGWRMAGAGATRVIGTDPSPLFVCQFFAMKHFIRDPRVWVLPLPLEELPEAPAGFDTVFSMGVLYHRKDPLDHVKRLISHLRPGGELVLETLIIDAPGESLLQPTGRYAKMRNVWAIPSVPTLESWLHACGLKDVCTVDITTTTNEEQRSTEWMTFESLSDFLHPENPTQTIEGYPAPKRAIVTARRA